LYASRLHILSAARFRLLALAFCVLAQAGCVGQVARTPPPPGQSVRFVPNHCNDAHDCPFSTADTWLKTRIDPLIHSPQFQIDGLLIIVFDEANTLDFTSGGGHVAAVIASPLAKAWLQVHRFLSTSKRSSPDARRARRDAAARKVATAPAMWEFFNKP